MVQEARLPLYDGKQCETVLSYFRRGGTDLWVPSNVLRKGESRNAYLERYFYGKQMYSRCDIALYLSVQRRVFIGNNSYSSFYSPCISYVYKFGSRLFSTRPSKGRTPTWFRRRVGDKSTNVRLKTPHYYCLYEIHS